MGQQWSYGPNDKYKTVSELVHMLVRVVSRGGNLLLNIGPDPEGQLPEPALDRLSGLGQWLAVNGSAIYETRPVEPYQQENIHFTRKDNTTYAIYLPGENSTASPDEIIITEVKNATSVRLVGADHPLDFQLHNTVLTVPLKQFTGSLPCDHAWTLAITDLEFELKP